METVIITTLVSTAAAGVSALLSWFLSKKKYYSEVDSSNIKNMQDSLQFYITLSDDYKRRLDEEIQSHKKEVAELKNDTRSEDVALEDLTITCECADTFLDTCTTRVVHTDDRCTHGHSHIHYLTNLLCHSLRE